MLGRDPSSVGPACVCFAAGTLAHLCKTPCHPIAVVLATTQVAAGHNPCFHPTPTCPQDDKAKKGAAPKKGKAPAKKRARKSKEESEEEEEAVSHACIL